jgi:V/A-type H+/Na+-transporting ATPase subunit F
MEFFVIGDHDTVIGFSLAGINGRSVDNPQEGLLTLKEAVESDTIGIILITEAVAQEIRDEIEEIIITMDLPLLVEIPNIDGPLEDKVTISDLVKSAIGISI